MTNGTPIESWTREQCEDYLKKYPRSLNSDSVRKRLAFLTPQTQQSQQEKGKKNAADVVEDVRASKMKEQKYQPKTYEDPPQKGMATVGKVVLTILVLVLCFGIVMLCVELIGGESAMFTGPVCAGVAIPLANKIWKK